MDKNNDKKITKKWLVYAVVYWSIIAIGMGFAKTSGLAQVGVKDAPLSSIMLFTSSYIVFPLLYGWKTKNFKGMGFTGENLRLAVLVTLFVTFIYSMIRGFLILYVPGSNEYVAATAIQTAGVLRENFLGAFPRALFVGFLSTVSVELFYRGFWFTQLRKYTHWINALLVSGLLFAMVHYFAAGLSGAIMAMVVSVVAGSLMQKYNNIVAPALFHLLQYLATIVVYLYIL